MKTIAGLALAAVLLLSWLCFIATNPSVERDDHALTTLNEFVATESGLRENILNARLGLLRDYDPLNQQMTRLHELIDRLRENGIASAALDPLTEVVDQQDRMTEMFKTNNALLQNALAYFGLLSGRFGLGANDETIDAAITALSTSILHLMLDPSAASRLQVQAGLDSLAKETQTIGDTDLRDGLLTHGRTLHDLLPATDDLLRSLHDLPMAARQDVVRQAIAAHQRSRQARADLYRLLLYSVSLFLLLILVLLGFRLKRLLQNLRRRATFEHAMAGISMRFVNARESDLQSTVEQALAELATRAGADRAYLIFTTPPQLFLWTNDATPWLQAWPEQEPVLFDRIARGKEEVLYHPSVAKMSSGGERRALVAAGLKGWLGMRASAADVNAYILGFESLTRPMTWPAEELGLLRLAADNISNAVGRRCLEREQARLESSLQKARRMETVGALASGVAHNFNNVIGAILGHTEMLEAAVKPESRPAQYVHGVRQAAERARDLVEQILHFGRQKEPPQRRVPLKPLMAETEALLLAALPDDAHLIVASVPDSATVYGDPTQLQQIIVNLCNNAYQALDGIGTISVAADVHSLLRSRKLTHGELPAGSYVCITVTDRGRGMNAATLERLFEPFFTTRPEGNGIGLATVHEIVTSYGGAINVTSRLGSGSSFEVWLPQAADTQAKGNPGLSAQERGRGETVLILNENPTLLLRDEEIVAALGYEPVGYEDLDQALAACRTAPNRFDAVLLSQIVPVHRGLAAATQLHALQPSTPILLAASTESLGADSLAEAGICEVVKTPLASAELASALPRWLPA
jgi:signal transduction histidine kinase